MAVSIVQYRNKWETWHRSYERRAYKHFKPVFNSWAKNIPWSILSESNYEFLIESSIRPNDLRQPYLETYREIGTIHGKRTGAIINSQLKAFQFELFLTNFELALRTFFNEYGVNRITSISETFFKDIISLLETRVERGLTIREASAEIEKLVNRNRFYRWQSERIARTESTAAANFAALQAGDVSGFVMEKLWISALDARTRRTPPDRFDHRDMNGKRVGQNEPFIVSGEELMYAGDPNGSAGNVIQCRCSTTLVPKRDSNGDLIPTS